ncbi:uL13 family ribosomal protein [Patescibacteria group bacterium]|nr:uL13 family ribosomal protein [Patescibacteria group bacterium]
MTTYTIDATGKKLGRVAAQAATLLRGKNSAQYTPHLAPQVTVKIENAAKLSLTEAKKTETVYKRFSGYQGTKLKIENLAHLAARKGYREGLRYAIRGMLPNNKLRPQLLKRVTITD